MQKDSRKKPIYFCFTDYTKAIDGVEHNKLWKILQEIGIQDHPTCHLKNLHTGQETTVRTGHGTMDLIKIGNREHQNCILSLWLSNLIQTDDNTLLAESEEELKSLLKMKEESEKAGLKLNIQKTKIMASGPITSGNQLGKQWKQCQTLFFWAPKSLKIVTAAMKLKDAYSLEGKL